MMCLRPGPKSPRTQQRPSATATTMPGLPLSSGALRRSFRTTLRAIQSEIELRASSADAGTRAVAPASTQATHRRTSRALYCFFE